MKDLNLDDYPEPPIPPPTRTFKETFWFGLVETNESKKRTLDWYKSKGLNNEKSRYM